MARGANRGVAAMHFLQRRYRSGRCGGCVGFDCYLRASFRSSDVIPYGSFGGGRNVIGK